jgi:hypothetical protein
MAKFDPLLVSPDGVSTAYLYTELAVELKRLGHDVNAETTRRISTNKNNRDDSR